MSTELDRVDVGGHEIAFRVDGPAEGPALVLSHALGTTHAIWDGIMPFLAPQMRVIRYDLRGHGQSSVPEGPYAMGGLIRDAERLLDHLNVRDAAFVGLSLSGMVAQGLAVKRLDQIRALVLSNTAYKIATPDNWRRRIEMVEAKGLSAISQETMQRWFPRTFLATPEAAAIKALLEAQPEAGYVGCCAAIAGTDFYTPTAGLRLPTLGIAGWDDGSTPSDLVRETVDLIPGSQFALLRRAGHLPCVDQPDAYADVLNGFLREVGHIG